MHWTSALHALSASAASLSRGARTNRATRHPSARGHCWNIHETPGGCWPTGGEGDDESEENGGGRGGRNRSSRRRQVPNIADELKRGEAKLVQVIKEPIGTKVSLPGRFLVYMPFASKVGVSRKIEQREQRAKLREMVSALVPKDEGGWIIRTVAEDLTEKSCKREIDHLFGLWKKISRKAKSVRPPALLQQETSLTRGIIRDLFSDKVDSLLIDSKVLHNEVVQYLKQVDPDLVERVRLYNGGDTRFDEDYAQ